jgi:hypothetical protein
MATDFQSLILPDDQTNFFSFIAPEEHLSLIFGHGGSTHCILERVITRLGYPSLLSYIIRRISMSFLLHTTIFLIVHQRICLLSHTTPPPQMSPPRPPHTPFVHCMYSYGRMDEPPLLRITLTVLPIYLLLPDRFYAFPFYLIYLF